MPLPPDYWEAVEAGALVVARDFIGRMKEGDFLNLGCAPLHPDAGRRLLRRLIQRYALNDSSAMLQVTEIAEQWDDAHIAICELIHEFHNRGKPLPAYLATYNDRIIAGYVPAKPQGRKRQPTGCRTLCFST
jgi:hypothetical protein